MKETVITVRITPRMKMGVIIGAAAAGWVVGDPFTLWVTLIAFSVPISFPLIFLPWLLACLLAFHGWAIWFYLINDPDKKNTPINQKGQVERANELEAAGRALAAQAGRRVE